MNTYQRIQKDEAHLWEKVFETKNLGDESILTYSMASPDNPNSNQLFYWGDDKGFNETIKQAAQLYRDIGCNGYFRTTTPLTSPNKKEALRESYLISSKESVVSIDEDKSHKIVFYEDVLNNDDFLRVFCAAFDMSKKGGEQFAERMKGIASKIKGSRFFTVYCGNEAVTVGGVFPTENYDFLMNLGTLPSLQNKGHARETLLQLVKLTEKDIVFRTANDALIKGIAPKCGFRQVAETFIYSMSGSE
ncbi:MAG: hypothetical protein GY909_05420 [Oligoflexia bacterium]|nr:hypothetical protein [Oligoflexia bacterium]